MKHLLLAFTLIIVLAVANNTAAQEGTSPTGYDNYYDYENNPDSTETPYEGGYDEYDPLANDPSKPKKPEKQPYVRIVMPFDTITELITYTEVIDTEESYYDSLYIRAKRYLMLRFSLKDKDFKESALEMDKIIMTLDLPYKVQKNRFVVDEVGNLEFKLALRFKDGKYKYIINHLKHILPTNSSGSTVRDYAYLEFYTKTERNIIYNDFLLRAADKQINSLIGEIKLALREPVIVDEDDW